MTEGRKMFFSVMAIFLVYALFFILFEDYDRKLFDENSDLHLLVFSAFVMIGLGFLLNRYSHRMDERISREQAEKEQTMRRQLTHNIAHELKTPLASITGFTETLIEHPDIDEQTRQQFLARTLQQAKRLTSLMQDISILNRMDYAPEALEVERVNVASLMSEITEETALALKKKQMKLRNCLQGTILVLGNPSLLYSIFRNLIDNAINYAGEGTTVDVEAHEQPDTWLFSVSDNGVGVAEEHLPRIFERFYRLDKGRSRSMGGTGLGLAIVKNAVTMHGGIITVSRNFPHGLRFTFTLKKSTEI